jgi:cobalt-zinc-cadmium efflux system outer membrane protein
MLRPYELSPTHLISRVWGACCLCLVSAGLTGCATYQAEPLSPTSVAARFDSRTLNDPGLENFLKQSPVYDAAKWPPQSWDLETLSVAAIYFNPAMELARAQWLVALGGDTAAGARLNPTLALTPGYNISAASGVVPWFPGFTLDVPVETAGKRRFRIAQSRHASESARLNILVTAWHIRSTLRSSLLDYSAAMERETLLKNQRALQQKILDSLQQQVGAGSVSRSELTLVRVAMDRMSLDVADAQQQSSDARVRVADALGLPAVAIEGIKLRYTPNLAAGPMLLSNWKEVRDIALQSRADILAALADYETAQSGLQLEIAKQYPDIHLGPGYQYDQGEHKFSLGITAELPILNQNQGGIAQAKARRTEAAAKFNVAQSKVIAEIDHAVASLKVSQQVLESLADIITSRKAQLQSLEEMIKAGAANRNDIFTAQMDSASGELLELSARLKVSQAMGALEDALQKPISSFTPELLQAFPATKE